MKKILLSIILIVVSIIHVHLSCFTVGNVINPALWVALCVSSSNMSEVNAMTVYAIIVMGIHCFVTVLIAWNLPKWKKLIIWFVSYFVCIYPLLFFCNHIHLDDSNYFSVIYDEIYGYSNALELVLIFSLSQIIYIVIYFIILGTCNIFHYNSQLSQFDNWFLKVTKIKELKNMFSSWKRRLLT